MGHYFDYEDREVEQEEMLEINEGDLNASVQLFINESAIKQKIENVISSKIENKIKAIVENTMHKELKSLLSKDKWSKGNIESLMAKAVEKRLVEVYPEVVENKINEFEKAIKELKFSDRHGNYNYESLCKTAMQRCEELSNKANEAVMNYINNELAESVSKSKEYIEQFSKNYFAQNLFRAMGMMDKMLPTTESMLDKK